MRNSDLQAVQDFLLSQRSDILNKANEFNRERLQSTSTIEKRSDESDVAFDDSDLSMRISLLERERGLLLQIDRTLGKIKTGEYGLCEACGVEISQQRLKIKPFALYCIDCQEDLEAGAL